MKKASALVALLAVLVAPAASASHDQAASDRRTAHRDPRGDVANRLDIVRVAFDGHGDGTASIVVRTHEPWGCRYLNRDLLHDGGVASLRWDVNTNRDVHTERTAFFACSEGKLSLHWGERALPAARPDGRTASVRIPLHAMDLDYRKHLAFKAVSFANGRFGHDLYFEETDASPALQPLR